MKPPSARILDMLDRLETVELQPLMRRISALPEASLLRLDAFVEELIEELEDTEDIAMIEAQKDEPTIPWRMIKAEMEAKRALHG